MSRISIFLCLLIISYSNYSQTGSCFEFNPDDFVLNGTAQLLNDEIVTLTEELNNQGGFLWSQNLVDFTYDFTLEAELNFGTIDSSGADGIAFVIQPLSSDQGSSGGGIGYQGISPSLAITSRPSVTTSASLQLRIPCSMGVFAGLPAEQ